MTRDIELGSGLADLMFDPKQACEGCGCRRHRKPDGTEEHVARMPCGGCEGHWLCLPCWVGCHEAALLAQAEICCDVVEGWRVAVELGRA